MTLTHDGKIAIWIEKKIKDSKWNKRRNFFNLGKNKTRTWSAKESYQGGAGGRQLISSWGVSKKRRLTKLERVFFVPTWVETTERCHASFCTCKSRDVTVGMKNMDSLE